MKDNMPKYLSKFYPILLLLATLIMGIGYSSSTISLDVHGVLIAQSLEEVLITDATCTGSDGATFVINSYQKTVFNSTVTLPDSDSSVVCTLDIMNLTRDNYAFDELVYGSEFYDNDDVEVVSNILRKTVLNSRQSLSVTLTFSYSGDDSNNVLNSVINLRFKKYHSITYENISDHNYPTVTFDGDNETIIFTDKPKDIQITGSSNYTYDRNTGVLNITNIRDDIVISLLDYTSGYFAQYNGLVDGLFGFDRTKIVSFERNSSLTLEQVLAKSGVKLISNVSDDQYNSDYPIYGWTENSGKNFYWWSEADIVYFHPRTLKAFDFGNSLVSVDLNGTSTEKVENFAHWFDTDKKLTTISGRIVTDGLKLEYNPNFNYRNVSNNDTSSEMGLAFMFNDCNSLKSIDLSGFNTTNASDMKRMFGGCKSITSLDLSNFDTSNVKSMHWMFRTNEKMAIIDLSSFDTRNVENMFGMFVQSYGVKTVILGENFDTSKVKYMTNMFYDMRNLTTIYAKSDFTLSNDVESSNMFYNTTNLIGGAGTAYETVYSSSYKDKTYARIANSSHKGYFTYDEAETKYKIVYDLAGGTASNPEEYYADSETFVLNEPVKTGYTFIGWTGSNGPTPQKNISIVTGTTGNKAYVANYVPNTYTVVFDSNGGTGYMESQVFVYDQAKNLSVNLFSNSESFMNWNTEPDGSGDVYSDGVEVINLVDSGTITLYAQWGVYVETFPKVFVLDGPCTFNGVDGNITGDNCSQYSGVKYINTNIYLFSNENLQKDFEIYFKIDEYSPSNQQSDVAQQTIMNSKLENQSLGYPGIVFRRSGTNLELKTTTQSFSTYYPNISTIKIIRRDGILYYSVNSGAEVQLHDISSFPAFDVPVWFGASRDSSGNPFRYVKATISDVYIKLGDYHN